MKSVRIETPHLIIRSPENGDAKPLNDAINRSLPELQRWMLWAKDPSLGPTEEFVADAVKQWNSDKPSTLPLILIDKASNQIIGASGYNERSDFSVPYYDIGYWLDTKYTGKGLAAECLNAQARYAFAEFKAVRVQICAEPDNIKSLNVAGRCGFKHEATLQNVHLECLHGKPAASSIYVCFDINNLPELDVKW